MRFRSEEKSAVYYDDDEHTACLVIRGREIDIEGIPREALALILQAQGNNTKGCEVSLNLSTTGPGRALASVYGHR